MHELKKQVKAEAREIKRVSDEKAQVLNVEKEIHKERLEAEREHQASIRKAKKEVEAETKELKRILQQQDKA